MNEIKERNLRRRAIRLMLKGVNPTIIVQLLGRTRSARGGAREAEGEVNKGFAGRIANHGRPCTFHSTGRWRGLYRAVE